MSPPSTIPQLELPDEAVADEAEVARCQEKAAQLVTEFAGKSGQAALDALIEAADGETPSIQNTLEIAQAVTAQTETLNGEVARFLSVTRTG